MELTKKLLTKFNDGTLAFADVQRVMLAMHLPPSMKRKVLSCLAELEKNGLILKDRAGRYSTYEQAGAFKARVKASAQGYAFLIPEGCAERENDYFVPKKRLCGALDRDTVWAVPVRGTEDEAAIVKIISRGRTAIVGRFERDGRAGYVIADDASFLSDVYIPLSLCGGAEDGDKVVAQITSYPKDRLVGGKIIEILGRDGDFLTEENAIIKDLNLNCSFPAYVTETAEKVAKQDVCIGQRRDLQSVLTVTIDGEDTRDIDDAVSLEVENGKYILGVHIADVAHYVKPNGCIDKEAYSRGTSVYFPDRVIPMLPQALSNGACSLNEGEPKLALSCIITFDGEANVISHELCESVIRSDKRLSYTQVYDVLEGREQLSPAIDEMLKNMQTLALALEARARQRGAVDLDVKEAHIYLEDGKIVIPEYKRTVAHRIIEQFMIAANCVVASHLTAQKLPVLYRVHEQPAPEKAESFYFFAKQLGLTCRGNSQDVTPCDYQSILNQAEGKPYSEVISTVMLRSMQKARYSEKNLKHFGLALECYCHFTSPIRRYPDLFVHRVLKCALHGEGEKAKSLYAKCAGQAGADCSLKERNAELAEREVDNLYKLAYMQERLGEQFDAVISGVAESGIFARLNNTVEGVIRLESLPNDDYLYYEDKFLLKGKRHAYKLGDAVRVKVAGCDFGSRRVQFTLV